MSFFNFRPNSPMSSLRMLVGIWRHDNQICKPGFYRVVPVADMQWQMLHWDAVCDDFGDLVPVGKPL